MAVGHTRRGRPVPPFEIPALPGAGALRSTAIDMLRFLEANLDPARTPWRHRWSASSSPGTARAGGCRWGWAG